MIKSIFRVDSKGFSLLELSVVLIIMSILASSAIPVLTRSFLEKAGEKVSLDMFAIEDAARAYYIANGSWPASINVLQTGNYLPSGWNAVNPFGNSYTTQVSGAVFTVSTNVTNGSQVAIINRLPLSSYAGNTVSSNVPIPGSEQSSLPSGAIVMWSGTIATIPSGWVLCDGTNRTPDLRNRFIVGAVADNSGVASTTVTDPVTPTYTQSGNGQLPSTSGPVQFPWNYRTSGPYTGYVEQFGTNSSTSPDVRTNSAAYTFSFGTGSLNVSTYYALAFIMKT